MEKEKIEKMIEQAFAVREQSYAPYSGFSVGACLETADGKLYTGCNIENGSYGATNCGERTAIYKAVSEGNQSFQRIVIVGGAKEKKVDYCPPCGICLQVMVEFCDPELFEVILAKSKEEYRIYLLKDFLPLGFRLEKWRLI
ncbi:MAG: cytidine deaminase [Clostridiaceae bacterium]|nr:cytidine deaminase [Clostridiaceae bacterium]